MDWMYVLEQVFELIIFPVISVAGIYLTYLISVKIKELKQKTNDETAQKYLDMLDVTIQNAVRMNRGRRRPCGVAVPGVVGGLVAPVGIPLKPHRDIRSILAGKLHKPLGERKVCNRYHLRFVRRFRRRVRNDNRRIIR